MKLTVALLASISPMLCVVAAPAPGSVSAGHDKIMAAMDIMIFKKIELKNATIEQAVRLLTKESKKSDPEHQGIRFVVRAPSPRPPASITLDEENASLKAVLKQIQQQTGYGYTVGDGALDLWYDSGEGLTRRTFTVPNGFFEITPEQAPQSSYDVKPQLAAKGIHFPAGMSAQYQPSQRQLIVTATPDQLEDIDDLLFHFSQQNGKGPQTRQDGLYGAIRAGCRGYGMRGRVLRLSSSRVEGSNGGHNFQHRMALLGAILRAAKMDVQKCGLTARTFRGAKLLLRGDRGQSGQSVGPRL